jgi:ATP-binding cassette subfamily B protein
MVRDRSALVISHRFSTVRMADRIYVLADGRVVEQGSHDSLVELGGLYAGLYHKQASYYGTENPAAGIDEAAFANVSRTE